MNCQVWHHLCFSGGFQPRIDPGKSLVSRVSLSYRVLRRRLLAGFWKSQPLIIDQPRGKWRPQSLRKTKSDCFPPMLSTAFPYFVENGRTRQTTSRWLCLAFSISFTKPCWGGWPSSSPHKTPVPASSWYFTKLPQKSQRLVLKPIKRVCYFVSSYILPWILALIH